MDNETQRQDKINQAYQLRLSGKTYRQIGRALGVSHVTARKWVTEHLESETTPLVDEVRKMEYDRMMRILDRLEDRALDGDDKALALMLKTSESLRKLLGADMPTVSVVENVEVTQMDLDIRALIDAQTRKNEEAKRLAALKGQEVEESDA